MAATIPAILSSAATAAGSTSLATVATYAGYGLTAVSAVGSIQAGASQRAAYQAEAKQQELQVKQAKINAEQAKVQARENYLRTVAKARAAYGAQGVSTSSGVAEASVLESRSNLGFDLNQIERNKQINTLQGREQASQSRKAGDSAFRSGLFNAAGTIGKVAIR